MTTATQTGLKRIPIGRFMVAGIIIWTLIIGYSLLWNMQEDCIKCHNNSDFGIGDIISRRQYIHTAATLPERC